MTAWWLLLVVVYAAGLSALIAYLYAGRLPARGKRVVVNLTDGTAMRGILLRTTPGPWMTLHDAELLRADGLPIHIDGAVYLERPRVLFVQVLP